LIHGDRSRDKLRVGVGRPSKALVLLNEEDDVVQATASIYDGDIWFGVLELSTDEEAKLLPSACHTRTTDVAQRVEKGYSKIIDS
jgi:hypothetical protein